MTKKEDKLCYPTPTNIFYNCNVLCFFVKVIVVDELLHWVASPGPNSPKTALSGKAGVTLSE